MLTAVSGYSTQIPLTTWIKGHIIKEVDEVERVGKKDGTLKMVSRDWKIL